MKLNSQNQRIVNVIKKVVCGYYDMEVKQLRSKTRKAEIVTLRQIAMYFCILIIGKRKISLTEVGKRIGGKDHATVLHACKKVTGFIETDREYRNQIEEIEALIKKALTPGNVVEQKILEKTPETAQISINDPEQYKVLAEERLNEINAMQERNEQYLEIILDLRFKLRMAEAQVRLYKKVQSYDKIPASILQGE